MIWTEWHDAYLEVRISVVHRSNGVRSTDSFGGLRTMLRRDPMENRLATIRKRAVLRLSGIALTALLSLLQTSAHALDPALAIGQLHHTQWRSEDAAPSNIVAIAQSADGFLWLGTGAGLYRFDGIRFERIKAFAGKALHSGSISALHAT
jgi:hypothetical protein